MNNRSRRTYPYSLDDSLVASRQKEKKRRPFRFLAWLVLLALLGVGGYWLIGSVPQERIANYLPFPKKLLALRFQHNGQEVILLPDSQCVVNPRDSLHLLSVQTDGWVSWGVKVDASDFDIESIKEQPAVIRDLMPQEDFETPKTVEIRVLLWNRVIGKVSFLVELDGKDWLQKATSATSDNQKIGYLEKALLGNPGNVLVKTQLAALYFEKKKYEEAARLYKEVDQSGKSKSVLERLLEVYKQQNQVDEALMVYLDLIKLSEDEEYFKEFLQYIQRYKSKDDAVRFLEKYQREIPRDFRSSLLLFLADLNTQAKNWDKAAASYERAIRSGVKDQNVLYNLVVTYQQSDNLDKAIPAMEKYLQSNPGDIRSWMQLGSLLEKKGAVDRARDVYEKVLEKSPQNKAALVRLVALLEKTNNKGALQEAYEKLARLQPENRTVQHNLAVLYYDSQKWDKAASAFEAIAARDSKDVESRKYLLDIYRKAKNEKAELETLKSLAQLDPKNSSYYDSLFSTYKEKGDYKGMVAFFQSVAERAPDSITFHNYLLYGLLKQGDSQGALKELEQLIRLQPKEKKHLKQAANLYENTGNYAEASKKLEQILKLDPKDKEAQDDYLRLRRKSLAPPKKKS
ncbi:tetratricopeptide repeat protein [Desulforhabdus amnigena]|uniref:Tetratricopeptide repeat protein n=1 Tax=Desulforhabdus amnigena TaxID=40218 RepID=A0A9W6CZ58_9BACT|nr:tetratricopeptide repeat protein [Desulforhabdus amnigena]GLI32805.1 hypothetical protein DAMNIGENAA_02380 [Desulforhabdus amnigena]